MIPTDIPTDDLLDLMADNNSAPPNLEHALAYAARGWRVFPVHYITTTGRCSCGYTDCTSPGKHPATTHGVKDATTDNVQITNWWTSKNWNIGYATGLSTIVIDTEANFDPKDFCYLPQTLQASTGGGGIHYYYHLHNSEAVKNKVRVAPNVDVRSDGGYVLLPPSNHVKGTYSWKNDLPIFDLKEAQEVAYHIIDKQNKTTSSTSTVSSGSKPNLEGEGRNNWLFSRISGLKGQGVNDQSLLKIAQILNADFKQPMNDKEVDTICNSVGKFPDGTPTVPKRKQLTTMKFDEMTYADENENASQQWIWEGYIGKGLFTLLSADPKAGKTTLLTELLRQSHLGGGVFHAIVKQFKMLIMSEESRNIWRDRSQLADLPERPFVHVYPPKKPTWQQWENELHEIHQYALANGIDLVVIDTISKLCPIEKESLSEEWDKVCAPLDKFVKSGIAMLVIHHNNKSRETHGVNKIRGGNGLPAYADILIGLSITDPANTNSDRRLDVRGRNIPEQSFTYNLDRESSHLYVVSADAPASDTLGTTLENIISLLPASAQEIMNTTGYSKTSVYRFLKIAIQRGRIVHDEGCNRYQIGKYHPVSDMQILLDEPEISEVPDSVVEYPANDILTTA